MMASAHSSHRLKHAQTEAGLPGNLEDRLSRWVGRPAPCSSTSLHSEQRIGTNDLPKPKSRRSGWTAKTRECQKGPCRSYAGMIRIRFKGLAHRHLSTVRCAPRQAW